jgi:hypothetical protein
MLFRAWNITLAEKIKYYNGSEGFWRWYITVGVTKVFLLSSIVGLFLPQGFKDWIYLHLQKGVLLWLAH